MEWFKNVFHLDLIPVLMLVAISGVAAWEDFRTGRIRNALLKRLILVAIAWTWMLVITVGFLGHDTALIRPSGTIQGYLLRVAANSGIALVIGVALWFGRLWAAGDSKLFPLMVLLLPLRYYSDEYVELWPGFVLFYNFVVATFLIILGDLANRLGQFALAKIRARGDGTADTTDGDEDAPPPVPFAKRAMKFLKEEGPNWGRFALMIILVFLFIKVLRHWMREAVEVVIHVDSTIMYVVLFFACHPIIHFMHKTWALIGATAIVIAMFLVATLTDWIPGLTAWELLQMSGMAGGLMIFRMAYDAYQARMDFIDIEVDDLQPKMILSESIMRQLSHSKTYFERQELELGPLLPDGLKPEQVPIVQRWMREAMPGQTAQIQKTFPMGPPLFLGLVLTIIFQEYVVSLPR